MISAVSRNRLHSNLASSVPLRRAFRLTAAMDSSDDWHRTCHRNREANRHPERPCHSPTSLSDVSDNPGPNRKAHVYTYIYIYTYKCIKTYIGLDLYRHISRYVDIFRNECIHS